MVDGSNLPMYINITKSSGGTKDKISQNGCVATGCTKPVDCPSALDVKAGGTVVGCISACARLGGDQYCCRGQWSSRAACDPAKWPVDYAAVFKKAEPYAYSYVDDDATSVFTCSGVCDYRITFGLTPEPRDGPVSRVSRAGCGPPPPGSARGARSAGRPSRAAPR